MRRALGGNPLPQSSWPNDTQSWHNTKARRPVKAGPSAPHRRGHPPARLPGFHVAFHRWRSSRGLVPRNLLSRRWISTSSGPLARSQTWRLHRGHGLLEAERFLRALSRGNFGSRGIDAALEHGAVPDTSIGSIPATTTETRRCPPSCPSASTGSCQLQPGRAWGPEHIGASAGRCKAASASRRRERLSQPRNRCSRCGRWDRPAFTGFGPVWSSCNCGGSAPKRRLFAKPRAEDDAEVRRWSPDECLSRLVRWSSPGCRRLL